MRPEQGFAHKTRVVKAKGHGKGRKGIVVEVAIFSGTWRVLWDDTLLAEIVNPHEFDSERNGVKK